MTDREFEEYLGREVHRYQFAQGALARLKSLQSQEKDRNKAIAERDEALAERAKVLAEIDKRKAADAVAADRERVKLADELRIMREASDKAVAKDKAEVAKLQGQIDRLLLLKTEGEERHAATMAGYAKAEGDARFRVEALIAQETEIRGRLTAALGR